MGCWAFGIYQSDDAMDWEGTHFDIVKIDPYEYDLVGKAAKVRARFEKSMPALFAEIESTKRNDPEVTDFQKSVGYQLLACLLMRFGCAIAPEAHTAICNGIEVCPEYLTVQELRARKGDAGLCPEAFTAAARAQLGSTGIAELIDRLTGRFNAIDRLLKEFREYDVKGGVPHDYKDIGSLEQYGTAEVAGIAA